MKNESKLFSPDPGLFFAETSLSLLLDNIDTPESSFFVSFFSLFFQHRNKKTKATNFTKQRRGTSLLHALSHNCQKSLDFTILL